VQLDDVSCWDKRVRVGTELSSRGVFLGLSCIHVDSNSPAPGYDRAFRKLQEEIREVLLRSFRDPSTLKDDDVIKAYRKFFWEHNIDPTKVRPAGEALARRVVRGSPIASINPLVDAGNLASMSTFVPIGIYDVDKISGSTLELRYAVGVEIFHPIGGEPRRLETGTPILQTDKGLVLHVYPHRDSTLTMVTEATRRALVIGAGVRGVPKERVLEAVGLVVEYCRRLGISYSIVTPPRIVGGE